jgi:hypothetical protein
MCLVPASSRTKSREKTANSVRHVLLENDVHVHVLSLYKGGYYVWLQIERKLVDYIFCLPSNTMTFTLFPYNYALASYIKILVVLFVM